MSTKSELVKKLDQNQINSSNYFTYLINPLIKTTKSNGSGNGSITVSYIFTGTSSNRHSNFLYVFFWYAYYLLFIPFRFRKVGEGKYEIYQCRFQQILCGFSHLLSILRLVTSLRTCFLQVDDWSPVSFFLLFSDVSSLVFKLSAFKLFWTKTQAFLNLINFLNCTYLIPYNPCKIESIQSIAIFCGAYTFMSFLRMAFGSTLINSWDWSPEWLYRRLVAEARFTFFLSNSTGVMNTAPSFEEITPVDTFLAVIEGLSVQSRFITGFFADLIILVHILTLWAPASGFANKMYSQIPIVSSSNESSFGKKVIQLPFEMLKTSQSTMNENLETVLKQFQALKTLSILVGEAIGDTIMPYVGEALFYYSIYFDSVLLTPDMLTRIILIFFYISALGILILSAEIVRKMRWFKIWLGDPDRLVLVDQNQLAVTLEDLANHSVGVTASGVLILNYSFVGTVVTVLITYFIIRLQTKANFAYT